MSHWIRSSNQKGDSNGKKISTNGFRPEWLEDDNVEKPDVIYYKSFLGYRKKGNLYFANIGQEFELDSSIYKKMKDLTFNIENDARSPLAIFLVKATYDKGCLNL